MEKAFSEDEDEYHRLLRQQIREGREHVLTTVGQIRQFHGLALRPNEAAVGFDGFNRRFQKARADAQRRAEVRGGRDINAQRPYVIEGEFSVVTEEPRLPSKSTVCSRGGKASPT